MANYGNPYQKITLAPAPTATRDDTAAIIVAGTRQLGATIERGVANYQKKQQDEANASALAAAADEKYGQQVVDKKKLRGAIVQAEDGSIQLSDTAAKTIERGDKLEAKAQAAKDEVVAQNTNFLQTVLTPDEVTQKVINMRTSGASEDNVSAFVQGEAAKRQAGEANLNKANNTDLKDFGNLTSIEKARLSRSQRTKQRVADASVSYQEEAQKAEESGTYISPTEARKARETVIAGADAATAEKIIQMRRVDDRNKVLDDRYEAGQLLHTTERKEDQAISKEEREYTHTIDKLKLDNQAARDKSTSKYQQDMLTMKGEERKERTRRYNKDQARITKKENLEIGKEDAAYKMSQQSKTVKGEDTIERRYNALTDAQQKELGGQYDTLAAKQKREKTAAGYDKPKTDEEIILAYKAEKGDTQAKPSKAASLYEKVADSGYLKTLTGDIGTGAGLTKPLAMALLEKVATDTGKSIYDYLFKEGDSEAVKAAKLLQELEKGRQEQEKVTAIKDTEAAYIKTYRDKEAAFNNAQKAEEDTLFSSMSSNPKYTHEVTVQGTERPKTLQELAAGNTTIAQAIIDSPTSTQEQVRGAKQALTNVNTSLATRIAVNQAAKLKETAEHNKLRIINALKKENIILQANIDNKRDAAKSLLKIQANNARISAESNAGKYD